MNHPAPEITVLIVDDHEIVREGLQALLSAEPGIRVVAQARTGREAVHLATKLRPQVVIMDLAMHWMNGWEATRQILKALPRMKVLVLSSYHGDDHIQQAIAAGAAAYLTKQTAAAELVTAIRELSKGNAFFSPSIAQRVRLLTYPIHQPGVSPGTPKVELTFRQAEVLQLIAEGLATKQIAGELGLSIKTIEKHRQELLKRLKIHNIVGLVRYAAGHDVVETNLAGVHQQLVADGRAQEIAAG